MAFLHLDVLGKAFTIYSGCKFGVPAAQANSSANRSPRSPPTETYHGEAGQAPYERADHPE